MKCSIVLFLLVAGTSNAFVTPQTGFPGRKMNARMSSKETDIEALKAAAAKAREEANRLAEVSRNASFSDSFLDSLLKRARALTLGTWKTS